MAKQVILNPLGSGGDVYPFLPIGNELQRRGFHVALMTNPLFQENAGQANVEFIPLGNADAFRELGRLPDLRNRQAAWKIALRSLAVGTMRESYELIQHRSRNGDTLVVSSPISFGAKLAQEKLQVPSVSLFLSPFTIRSCCESPRIRPLWLGAGIPRFFKSIQYRIADRFFIDPVIAEDINSFRKALGLNPIARIMNRWLYSSQLNLALFPETFAAPQPDWPTNFRVTGPIDWAPPHDTTAKDDLNDFIQNEHPLLLLGGSIGLNTNHFYEKSIEAARIAGKKLILLVSNPQSVPRQLPDHVFFVRYYPIAELLDRCSILIHSGGIGATLQSLNHGVPQLVLPQVNDQHDNADRVERMRLGKAVSSTRISVPKLADVLQQMLADVSLTKRCAAQTDNYDNVHSVDNACDAIEEQFDRRYG